MNVIGRGFSGAVYSLQLCYFGRPFNLGAGGVYAFCKRSGNVWLVIYVGETENFDDRLNINLRQHHQWDCIQREGATHVCAVRLNGATKALRCLIQADLRRNYDPPCNRQ